MAVEEAPDRAGRERGAMLAEQFGQLDQGDVYFGLDRRQDHVAIGLDVMRAQIATLRQGRLPAFSTPGTHPTNRTRNCDAETLGRRIAGGATVNNGDYPVTKILGQRSVMQAGLLPSMHAESHRAASEEELSIRCVQIVL